MTAAPPSEPVAPADSCQRWGKLGGHGVEFRFDGISMSSWICPHCLDAQEKRIAQMEAAIRWACGEEPLRDGRWFDPVAFGHIGKVAPYWWRSILRLYSGIDACRAALAGGGAGKP